MDSTEGSQFDFHIPDHKLIRRIGRGSYGQVWLAQSVIGTFRAVKIVCRRDFNDDAPYQRELNGIQRFEPLSRSHPGFINVLHVGHDAAGRYFYYVMELGDDVSGSFTSETYAAKTLDSMLRSGRRLAADEILRLGLSLSDALHHLHESGLVHRDIKPSNILFVGGLPKLADIGLVTALDEARSFVGTPGYIPPEGPGTRQADVYALGKVFYEALTGMDRQQFPDLPTFFADHSQEERFLELNAIINRACHHDVAVRYPSARALHAELVAIENGRSVIRLHDLERKWSKAKRWMRVAAVSAMAVGVALFVAIREWTQAEREQQQKAGFLTGNSLQAVQNGEYATALRDVAQVVSVLRDDRSQTVNRLRYGTILSHIPKLTWFESYGTRVNSVEFAPGNQGMLVALGDGRCQMIDSESGRVVVEYSGHKNSVLYAIVSPDGKLVATGGMDGTARLWDRWTGRQLQLLEHPASVSSLDFHPQGGQLVTGCEDGVIRFWEIESARLLDSINAHKKPVDCIRFSHSGDLLVSGGRDNQARLWNTLTRQPVGEPIRHASWVAHAAFSPDDHRLVTGCHDKAAYVWAVDSRTLVTPPLRHQRAVRHVEFSPDGRYILTAGWDNVVRQWNALSGSPEGCVLDHSSPVMCAVYSTDGRRIASGCVDGTLRIWDQAGKAVPRIVNPNASVLSEDGSRFVSKTDTNLEIYLTASSNLPEARIPFSGKLRGTFFTHDGSRLATVTEEPDRSGAWCGLWQSQTGRQISPKFPLSGRPVLLVFGYQGESLVGIFSNHVELINFDAGQVRHWPVLTNVTATNACFSRDDRSLAIVAGSQVFVFDCESHRLRFGALQHPAPTHHASFSPDGKHLVTCTLDNNVQACYAQVWDSQTGTPQGVQRWHTDGVEQAAWFPDSERFVTVGEDGVGKIWSLHHDAPIGAELRHDYQIKCVEVGVESRTIVTGSQDLSARLWDADSGLPIGPPVPFPYLLHSVRFSNSERQLAAHDMNGVVYLASIVNDDVPERMLSALAHLLNGRLEVPINGDEFRAGREHAAAWNRLKNASPDHFSVTSQDIIAWHRMEAERDRALKQRRAELFHLNLLLELIPEDRYLTPRRKHVQEVLAAEPGSRSP